MPRTKVQFVLTEKRVINEKFYDQGHIILEGEIPEGLAPQKIHNIILQQKAAMYLVPVKEKEKTPSDEPIVVNEKYLNSKTKAELVDLAKEIELDKYLEENEICKAEDLEKAKKTELVDYFLNRGFNLEEKVIKE